MIYTFSLRIYIIALLLNFSIMYVAINYIYSMNLLKTGLAVNLTKLFPTSLEVYFL